MILSPARLDRRLGAELAVSPKGENQENWHEMKIFEKKKVGGSFHVIV